jgi:uncharacterized membrane protein
MKAKQESEKKATQEPGEKKEGLFILLYIIFVPMVGFVTYFLVVLLGPLDAFASLFANAGYPEIGQLISQLPVDVWYSVFGIGFIGGFLFIPVVIYALKKKDILTYLETF